MADIRLKPLPQIGGDKSGTVTDRAVAQRIDHSVRVPSGQAPTGELDSLMRGLSQFNSALGQYTSQAIEQDRLEQTAHVQRLAAAQAAAADASSPEAIQQAVAADLPNGVPAAYGGVFREAFGALLVDRQAIKAKEIWAAEYAEAQKDPDFNHESFIAQQRAKILGGLTDPGLAGRMGTHLNELEGSVRSAAEKRRLQRLDEERESGLHATMQYQFRADMSPEQMGSLYLQHLPQWEKLGFSKKELATRLFERTVALSEQMGGDPKVFEVFNQVDPTTGQSLLSMNPDLQAKVDSARGVAKAKNLAMLKDAAQTANLPKRVELDNLLETNPSAVTMEVVQRNMGPLGLFQTTDEAAAYLARARSRAASLLGDAAVAQAYDAGMLGRYKPEDQKKVLEARLGPVIDRAWQAAVQGDGNAMAGLSAFLMAEQNRSRSTVPVDAIERLVQTTLTTVQDPEGPPPQFAAMAALYRGLSADPKFRAMYFKDDAAQLMEGYLSAMDGRADPKAAYTAAYRSVSPEAKEAARKLRDSPDFAKKIKSVQEHVGGVGFADRWVPFWGGSPSNGTAVQVAAADAARQFMAQNPWVTEKQAAEYAHTWARDNFVFDRTSGVAVRVPAGSADEATSEALSEYSKRVAAAYSLQDRNDGAWTVQYSPPGAGDGNQLTVWLARDGVPQQSLGALPLASLRTAMAAEKHTTPQDAAVFGALQTQMRTGKLDLAFVETNSGAIEKARRLDLLPSETLKAIDKARLEQAKAAVDSIPKLALPVPALENLSVNPKRAMKTDKKLTSDIAQRVLGAGGHMGLAASLVTMGEDVVLRASPDPAKDAGQNLGMGYNLKGNSKTYQQDLARAGVPDDRIEAVARGDAQLTPSQAQKLLLVTLPRYEKTAQTAAEATAPGLWSRMTPHQRAVMVDVAWQTGDPAQFKKAWGALARGDATAFAAETRVFFTNQKGERVEDKRRGELRAAMLAGDTAWMTTISKYGSLPSTALDAMALNQPK